MSTGGLKTISESPVDSLRDSDQFSIKVCKSKRKCLCLRITLTDKAAQKSFAPLCFSPREMRFSRKAKTRGICRLKVLEAFL